MSQPLFEVSHLRVAAFDSDRSLLSTFGSGGSGSDIPGPVTDSDEPLSPGWVEVLPDMTFSVHSGGVPSLVGESGSGTSLWR